MQSKNNMKRKGFTLVELLIVIVVIGILSAMMMLSSTEAVTSAKASNVVSNLRNLKTAALALYVDSLDTWESETDASTAGLTIDAVKGYLNNGSGTNDYSGYKIATHDGGSGSKLANQSWYMVFDIGKGGDAARIQAKLEGRAKSVGLLKATGATNVDGKDETYKATDGQYVAMKVR